MEKVRIELGARSYDVLIGMKTMAGLGRALADRGFTARNLALVTSPRIGGLYYDAAAAALADAEPAEMDRFDLADGEEHKNLDHFCQAVRWLAQFARNPASKPVVVALGGGVVGDLAGFAAASYRRGVPYIQVPTTLLAAVDSSVGGKTAVNLPEGKNLCGAFYQPRLVYVDLAALRTLEDEQLRSGMAEVIKYGAILDAELFQYLEQSAEDLMNLERQALLYVVPRCVQLKAKVVAQDERESGGVRICLNFGHTLGHCIEKAAAGRYTHGAAVGIGMVAAARIAEALDACGPDVTRRIVALLESCGLPTAAQGLDVARVLSYLQHDKKFTSGRNRFILLTEIGHWVEYEDVPEDVIMDAARSVLE